jgi:glycosyltransferase involved in cell wall biosynthesis
VCTSSGGMAEIVDDKVGRVAAPDDPADLAAKVIEAVGLAALPGTAAACAEHAKQWDWAAVGPMHERVYAQARG